MLVGVGVYEVVGVIVGVCEVVGVSAGVYEVVGVIVGAWEVVCVIVGVGVIVGVCEEVGVCEVVIEEAATGKLKKYKNIEIIVLEVLRLGPYMREIRSYDTFKMLKFAHYQSGIFLVIPNELIFVDYHN